MLSWGMGAVKTLSTSALSAQRQRGPTGSAHPVGGEMPGLAIGSCILWGHSHRRR